MGGRGARVRGVAGAVPGRGIAGGAGGVWGGALGLGGGAAASPFNMAQNQPQGANDHGNWATMSQGEVDSLRRSMGQTGNEAGRTKGQGANIYQTVYVGTSKSYNINKGLNTDMQSIDHPDSPWTHNGSGYGKQDVRNAVHQMDNGMKPLTQNVNATRIERSSMTLSTFGINKSIGEVMNMSQGELDRTFTGKIRYNKGYTSVALHEKGIKMAGKADVCIEYTVKKGTKAIVTNNISEVEAIIGRGYAQKATGARVGNAFGKKMLIVNVTTIPEDQSQWYGI